MRNGIMRYILASVGAVLCAMCGANAQTAENLDFSKKNFAGWKMETGAFRMNAAGTGAEYEWTNSVASPNDNFRLINQAINTDDPIIACSGFQQNPFSDGTLTMRLGKYSDTRNMEGAEGYNTAEAFAEKATYTFTVTEETKAMIVNFACVVRNPRDNKGKAEHTDEMGAMFAVEVEFEDGNGNKMTKPCANFESLSEVDAPKEKDCGASLAVNEKDKKAYSDYIYVPWTSTVFDLQGKEGWKVTLTAISHDCIESDGTAGLHEAYGYIYAKTSNLELETNNCVSSGDDPTIFAPEGFASYTWQVNGAASTIFTKLNASGSRVSIDRASMTDGDVYNCVMKGSRASCDEITLSTGLMPVEVKPEMTYTPDCNGKIDFTNKSVVTGDDDLFGYAWAFGDEGSSVKENPSHTFSESGDYTVKLTGTTKLGCQGSKEFTVSVPYFPKSIISAEDTVCSGKSTRLTANNIASGSQVMWMDSTRKNIIGNGEVADIVVENSGWFYVYCEDAMGCGYRDSAYVNVVSSPKIFLTAAKDTICEGDSTTLKASSLITCTYAWSNGDEGMTAKVFPNGTSKFTCTATSAAFGCKSEEDIEIVVAGKPDIGIIAPSDVCDESEAKLKGSGGVSYEWSIMQQGATEEIYYSADSITIVPKKGDVYKVIGRDARGCVGNNSATINILEKPVIEISGNTNVCIGKTANLRASGAETYVWNEDIAGDTYDVRMDGSVKRITVVGTKGGCEAEASVTLEILPSPVLWVDGDSVICPGEFSMVTAHGAQTYTWSNGKSGSILQESPNENTKYTLTGESDNGCTASMDVNVTVRTAPTITLSGETSACLDSTVQLSASGAKEYSWSIGKQGEAVIVAVKGTQSITVVGTDENGCQGKASTTISPVAPPTLSYSGDTTACMGETITLTGAGAEKYEWHYDGKETKGEKLEFVPKTDVFVRLIGSLNNCKADMFIKVKPVAPPNVLIQGDRIVCKGKPCEVRASGAKYYKWSTGETTNKITYAPEEETTFYITGRDEMGCEGTSSYTVKVYPETKPTIIFGSETGCADKGDQISLRASGGIYYEWSADADMVEGLDEQRNAESIKVSIFGDTEFHLFCRDANGCEGEITQKAIMSERHVFDFKVSPKWIEPSAPNVSFHGIYPESGKWTWQPYGGAAEITGKDATYTYDVNNIGETVTVTVEVTDDNGCQHRGEYELYVWKDFFAPNAFSPNHDDKNDKFKFYGGRFVVEFNFIIYDRSGAIVYEGRNIEDAWDGTKDGVDMPWGTYGWVCNYRCAFNNEEREGQERGFVTLIR